MVRRIGTRAVWLALTIAAGIFAVAGERGSEVWLGEDVTASKPASPAAHFRADGVVVIYIGATVPGVRDASGKPVKIRKVEIVR